MITLIAMIIYVCLLNDSDTTRFMEEMNRSRFFSVFVGLLAIVETLVELLIWIIKLIFKKR